MKEITKNKDCPFCLTEYEGDPDSCPYCGANLNSRLKACPECGNLNPIGIVYCRKCHTDLTQFLS